MSSESTSNGSSTVSSVAEHATGAELIAVAESVPENQPGEDKLSHIFSCDQCSSALRDLRQGLNSIGEGSASPLDADNPMAAAWDASRSGDDHTNAAEARARKFAITVAIIGAMAAVGMLLFKVIMGGMK